MIEPLFDFEIQKSWVPVEKAGNWFTVVKPTTIIN